MRIEKTLIAGLTGLVLLSGYVFHAPTLQSAVEEAARLQQRYASVTSVAGDFQQNYHAPGVDISESGAFWMRKPGLMRWEYRDPETKLFVSDGHETYLYRPEDRQVLVSRFSPSELHSTPLEFLLGRGEILKSFKVSDETQIRPRIAGDVLLRLEPVEADPSYAYFVLECDPKNSDLRRIVIRENAGNTSEFILTNLQANVQVDNKRFEFKIPKGVEVIRVDEK